MHLKDTANTLFLALGSVQNVGTGIHGTGVHTEECQLTYERVSHDLECQSCERLFIRRVTEYFIAIHIGTLDRRDIGRSRHKLKNCVQKFLNTFVSVCTTAAYRNSSTLTGSFSQSCFQLVNRGLLTFQISHHQIIIQLADLLYQLGVI